MAHRRDFPLVEGFLGLPARATEAFLVGFLRRDYGAAGLFALQKAGQMDAHQVVVSLVTITLFVPCIANFFMMIKERGPEARPGNGGVHLSLRVRCWRNSALDSEPSSGLVVRNILDRGERGGAEKKGYT